MLCSLQSRLVLLLTCGLLSLAGIWHVSAQEKPGQSDAANRLRAAGIQPTKAGIQQYFETLLSGKAREDVAKFIAELGHEDFTIRERASRALAEIVPIPVAELTAATKGHDVERAWRAQRLLKAARPQNARILTAALEVVTTDKLLVGLSLMLKLYRQTDDGEAKSLTLAAAIAIVREADRAEIEGFTKDKDKTTQDIGRVLLARLDNKDLPLDLARKHDAVKVIPGSIANGGSNLVTGWEFRPKAELTITHLGIFDRKPTGLTVAHQVALWDLDNQDKPLALESIPAGEKAELAGEFRLMPTTKHIHLKAERHYAIVAHYPNTEDATVSRMNPPGLTIQFASHFDVLGRRYHIAQPAMAFPARLQSGADHATIGPTFRYETLELGK